MKVSKTTARILFLLYVAVLLFLCFGKFSHMPDTPSRFLGIAGDKAVHFLMFLPFPVLTYFAFPHPAGNAWRSVFHAAFILAVGALLAVGTEFVQGFLPYREADTADFTADFIALCLSTLAVLTIDLRKHSRHA